MAYAALLSLSQTLDRILVHDPYISFEKETLVSLNTNVNSLLTFLEEYWHKCRGLVNPLESRIIDAAYNAEDIIEYQFSSPSRFKFFVYNIINLFTPSSWLEQKRNFASLQKVLDDIDLILEEAEKLNNYPALENVSLSDAQSLSTGNSSDINTMVLEDDFAVIKERIYKKSCNIDVIPIVGMGGIGKTTLARRLYEDCVKQRYFDRCIWVVVSQDYSRKKLFSDIMMSLGKPDTGDLKQVIYQELFGRRYVIVVDDLWSEEAWDDLNLILPKDTAGSLVLVTTRLSQVASYVGSSSNPPQEMQLLNEYKSWKLFEERVFGEGFSCPSELKQIGKKLVNCCQGLPLTIVVIAGLLKGDTTKEYWKSISKNISSSEPTIALHCSKVLSLSYNHLPLYLRPCFLYMTVFPEDYEIEANRLIRLWMAEGFVKSSGSKLLEEVAEGYLHDLVGRSLIMVSKKTNCNGSIKTVRIHDVLRDFGISNSQQERFHYHHDIKPEYRRRVTIYNPASLRVLLNFHKPTTRSVLIPYMLPGYHSFENLRLLRVLDAWDTYMHMKGEASNLEHLRYLSIPYADYTLLKSVSEFRNIETLIIQVQKGCVVPLQLWKSPSLRHLILPPLSRLEQTYEDGIYEETNLQTIQSVTNLRLTKKVVEMLRNIRKFKIRYEPVSYDLVNLCNDNYLFNLLHLQKLEKLTISFSGISIPCFYDLAFPKYLKKLSLTFSKGLWKDMSIVGSLPNLEVFKLRHCWLSSNGGTWEPIEGQFLKLQHLEFEYVRLDHWEAESMNFPSLETLVLKSIEGELCEIPSGIGEIDTLKVIKLAACDKSMVDSAKQIQADQWEMGNRDLQLFVTDASGYETNRIYEEIRPDEH